MTGKEAVARERYEDLCEYFNNNPHTIEQILNDRKEFKAWLERMHWHVLECEKLARKLEALEGKDNVPDTNVGDTISRRDAIDEAKELYDMGGCYCDRASMIGMLNSLPSAQPERPSEIQDILDYLDTVLHPIISPEHWNVYSELHDMISGLPSAEPKRGKWEITNLGAVGVFDSCSECKRVVKHKAPFYNYCPNCGADMRVKESDRDYERAVEQFEHDMLYEPTFNPNDGSM